MGPAAELGGDTYAPLQGEFLGGLIEVDDKLNGLEQAFQPRSRRRTPKPGALEEIALADGGDHPAGTDLGRAEALRARWVSAIRDFPPATRARPFAACVSGGNTGRRRRRPCLPRATTATTGARPTGPTSHSCLEYGGAAILFCGRIAHARTLAASLTRLAQQRGGEICSTRSSCRITAAWAIVCDEWVSLVDSTQWLNSIISTTVRVRSPRCKDRRTDQPALPEPRDIVNYRSPSTERLKADEGGRWTTVFPEPGMNQGPPAGFGSTGSARAARRRAPRAGSGGGLEHEHDQLSPRIGRRARRAVRAFRPDAQLGPGPAAVDFGGVPAGSRAWHPAARRRVAGPRGPAGRWSTTSSTPSSFAEPDPEPPSCRGTWTARFRRADACWSCSRRPAAPRRIAAGEVLVRILASPHLAVLPWELLPDPAQRIRRARQPLPGARARRARGPSGARAHLSGARRPARAAAQPADRPVQPDPAR